MVVGLVCEVRECGRWLGGEWRRGGGWGWAEVEGRVRVGLGLEGGGGWGGEFGFVEVVMMT
eukprot:COSAG01_NODE_60593_length_294_cov_0.410256_1_plen_60_part_01